MEEVSELAAKNLHDLLLAGKPEGAEHEAASCKFCTVTDADLIPDSEGGGTVSEKTYTQEEVEAQIASAVASLNEQLEAVRSEQADASTSKAVEEATAPLNEKIAALEADLDKAQIEKNEAVAGREAAELQVTEVVAYLESVQTEAEAAAQREQVKADRIEKVREVAKFDDEEIAAKADRWADMSDEVFESILEDYKDIAEKASASGQESGIPGETAMDGRRRQTQSEGSAASVLAEISAAGYTPGRRI